MNYWIRIGTQYGGDGLQARWYILKEGLAGRIPDGVLVRASQRIRNGEETVAVNKVMEGFLVELIGSLPLRSREMLIK